MASSHDAKKKSGYSLILSIIIIPFFSALVNDLTSQPRFHSSKRDMGMTILSTVGTEEDVGAPIVVYIGFFSAYGTVVRTTVAGLEVFWKVGSVTIGVLFIALCACKLPLFSLAGFTDEVDELEGIWVCHTIRKTGTTITGER